MKLKKILLIIVVNIFFVILWKYLYKIPSIGKSYETWKKFYSEYDTTPLTYIEDKLLFPLIQLISKITEFSRKLSFLIKNISFNIDDFDEDENEFDSIIQVNNNNETELGSIEIINENSNIFGMEISDNSANYDNYYEYAIEEINIMEKGNRYEQINIKYLIEKGFNKNKIVILFIFFLEQLKIFFNLKQKINLNLIYELNRNRTNINDIDNIYENLFDQENIKEILIMLNEFINTNIKYNFFDITEFQLYKNEKLTKFENELINIVKKYNIKNKFAYEKLNGKELIYFFHIIQRTAQSIKFLGSANYSFERGMSKYYKKIWRIRFEFGLVFALVNLLILIHYDNEDEEISHKNKKHQKKHKFKYD